MKRGKYRNRVGLDIGSDTVKIVELFGPPDKPVLVSFGSKKIVASQQDGASRAIKSLAQELSLSSKEACISLSGQSLIVRLISMPRMTDEELASAVRFETEKFIPFDINDCILDFKILGSPAKDKTNVDVLLAAAKKERVLQRIKTAEEAGFSVKTVDADIFAAINSFTSAVKNSGEPRTATVLNIGASSTGMGIIYQETPVFVREIAIGGNDFSASIAKKVGLSQEAAETLKLSPKEKAGDAISGARPVMSNLIDEIRLSFGYHENQTGRNVDDIYLSGGAAATPGLQDLIHETLGIKPVAWDPFAFLDTGALSDSAKKTAKDAGSFCVAVGLAMR